MEEVLAAAHTVWSDTIVADQVALSTMEIISKTYSRKFVFFNGKSSKSLVGGLFYILGFKYDVPKKQRELADKLSTTDVTIRSSYKQWLETFPDLFLDVLAKLAQDSAFRQYVLIDFKPKIQVLQSQRQLVSSSFEPIIQFPFGHQRSQSQIFPSQSLWKRQD